MGDFEGDTRSLDGVCGFGVAWAIVGHDIIEFQILQ